MTPEVTRPAGQPAGATRPPSGRAMPQGIIAVSCAVLLSGAGLLIAGCSGAAGSSAASSASAARPLSGQHAAANGAVGSFGMAGRAGTAAAAAAARLAPASASIIYTASITIDVTNVATEAAAATAYVSGAGGYTAAEQAQLSPGRRQRQTASLTLKVPVPDYGPALAKLAGLGRQTALSQQSTDVTQEVADVNSRVTSEQDAIAQLRTLLRKAGTVSGLLQVQQQIATDESSLEALQAQQRALDHETSYATIDATLLGPRLHHVARHRKTHEGFVSGLGSGWRGLRHTTSAVLTGLGLVLPFLAVVAVIGGLGFAGWRRVARRRTPRVS
jgi:hypothetical protein